MSLGRKKRVNLLHISIINDGISCNYDDFWTKKNSFFELVLSHESLETVGDAGN